MNENLNSLRQSQQMKKMNQYGDRARSADIERRGVVARRKQEVGRMQSKCCCR